MSWGEPWLLCIRLSLHRKKNWYHLWTHLNLYTCLLPPLLFSLKCMTWYAFKHKTSNYKKKLSQKVFPVCPNWATLVLLNKCRKFDKQLLPVHQICSKGDEREYWQLQSFLHYTQTQSDKDWFGLLKPFSKLKTTFCKIKICMTCMLIIKKREEVIKSWGGGGGGRGSGWELSLTGEGWVKFWSVGGFPYPQ